MRKIAVPTKFQLGDITDDILRRKEEGEQRERDNAKKQTIEERSKNPQSHTGRLEGWAEKRPETERSDIEMVIEDGGETSTFHSQTRCKKEYMANVSIADSDKEAIVDFVKNYEELYNKTNEHFKDKAGKKCL